MIIDGIDYSKKEFKLSKSQAAQILRFLILVSWGVNQAMSAALSRQTAYEWKFIEKADPRMPSSVFNNTGVSDLTFYPFTIITPEIGTVIAGEHVVGNNGKGVRYFNHHFDYYHLMRVFERTISDSGRTLVNYTQAACQVTREIAHPLIAYNAVVYGLNNSDCENFQNNYVERADHVAEGFSEYKKSQQSFEYLAYIFGGFFFGALVLQSLFACMCDLFSPSNHQNAVEPLPQRTQQSLQTFSYGAGPNNNTQPERETQNRNPKI